MIIKYIGKKEGLSLTLPYLTKQYDVKTGDPFEVEEDDGKLLLDKFPKTFVASEPEPEETAGYFYGNGGAADYEADFPEGEKVIVEPEAEAQEEEFTFETDEAGSFLCPLCEKSYKYNLGRGKAALVKHLEADHTEEWAKKKAEAFTVED